MADITQNTNDIPELQSPFEQLREVDADGREWWNSRKLARVMGYGKYWNSSVSLPRRRLGLRGRVTIWESISWRLPRWRNWAVGRSER